MNENMTTRKLIYVDASGMDNNTIFKISLYDPYQNATLTLQLRDSVINSTEAEKYAIYYAIYYTQKYKYNNIHILCDNQSAVNSEDLKRITKRYKIGLSWIPREANVIADKVSKLDPNQKEVQLNILEFIIDLNASNTFITSDNRDIQDLKSIIEGLQDTIEIKNKRIKELETNIVTKNTKIQNQATQINSLKK